MGVCGNIIQVSSIWLHKHCGDRLLDWSCDDLVGTWTLVHFLLHEQALVHPKH